MGLSSSVEQSIMTDKETTVNLATVSTTHEEPEVTTQENE